MKRKRKLLAAAVPLSEVPELQALLQPFLGSAGARGNVVMVRTGDEQLARLDQLVDAGLFGSRSEAAAFLIGAGIKAQQELFTRIQRQSIEIQKLRATLRESALGALRRTAGRPTK